LKEFSVIGNTYVTNIYVKLASYNTVVCVSIYRNNVETLYIKKNVDIKMIFKPNISVYLQFYAMTNTYY